MHENEIRPQRAILAAVDLGEYDADVSLDELQELARTAGAEVLGRLIQRREEPDRATYLGSGRLEELKAQVQALDCNLVLFDDELSPRQHRNLEDALNIAVVDRTALILDIFAQRAVSGEGKLQVELAQQRYLLPRLAGLGTSLSRLGGGIGTRGPGESKLESDRRHIHRHILSLERQLRELSAHRQQLRTRRKKDGVTTIALVGYTNVGKSTLLNALTGADVFAEDKLFATLDPTARALELPDGRTVVLIDTVGFIRRLPHQLVEAFKSTLEEAVNADLILDVCDISSEEVRDQVEVTESLLTELGVTDTPILTVYNKCDTIERIPVPLGKGTVLVSARTGLGFEHLLAAISHALTSTQKRLHLLIPYAQGSLIHEIMNEGRIFTQEFTESGTLIDALVDHKLLYKLGGMILPDSSI